MTLQAPFRSLKRNYFFSAVSAVSGILYPIITLAYVARVMGPGALGKYYFANSLAVYFLFAAGLGIPIYATRELGRLRDDHEGTRRIFTHLFFLNLLSSVFFGIIYIAVVGLVPGFRAEATLFGVLGLLILNNVFSVEYLYAGLERQDQMAYRSLISKLVSIALIFTLVRGPEDILWFAGITVFTAFLNTALAWKGLTYWGGFKHIVKGSLRPHLRPILLLALSLLLINVYVTLDTVILGLLTNTHDVGLYNAALRPCRLAVILMSSMMAAALPRLSYYFNDGGSDLSRKALQKKTLEIISFFAVPISFTLFASASQAIGLLYGPGFLEAAPALALAAPLVLLNCMATFQIYQILVPLGKEGSLVITAAAAAALSVVLNLTLIPVFGYHGAVLAALGAEAISLVVQAVLIRRAGSGLFVLSGELWKYVAAGILLILVQKTLMPLTAGSHTGWMAVWAASLLVYVLALWAIREPFSRQFASRLVFRRG